MIQWYVKEFTRKDGLKIKTIKEQTSKLQEFSKQLTDYLDILKVGYSYV